MMEQSKKKFVVAMLLQKTTQSGTDNALRIMEIHAVSTEEAVGTAIMKSKKELKDHQINLFTQIEITKDPEPTTPEIEMNKEIAERCIRLYKSGSEGSLYIAKEFAIIMEIISKKYPR
jgi:hypothetical protein